MAKTRKANPFVKGGGKAAPFVKKGGGKAALFVKGKSAAPLSREGDMVAKGKMSPVQASKIKHKADAVLGKHDCKYHNA
jgi:hypothetical protein